MALTCPLDLDTQKLQNEIRGMYTRVASQPEGEFHFHRGREYAALWLGYDSEALAEIPLETTSAFAGVANPLRIDSARAGSTVLDIGCGAGMDLLLAARQIGPNGHAIGVDMTEEMVNRARASAAALKLPNVEVRMGDAMSLPVDDASIDLVISNGVLNLTPDKSRAFAEVLRVLKPGGSFQYGDIILGQELSVKARGDIDLWTE